MKKWSLVVLRTLLFPWGVWWYTRKVREYRLILRAQIGFEYGRDQLAHERVRRLVNRRTLLWWVRPERFHKKEAAWEAVHTALEVAAAEDNAQPVELTDGET